MDSQSSSQERVTWNHKYPDFTVVLKSREELRVHKEKLAANSPVFDAMLTQDMQEARSNKCTIENFEDETVVHFFQYLYSDCLQNKHAIELIRSVGDLPQQPVWKKIKDAQ